MAEGNPWEAVNTSSLINIRALKDYLRSFGNLQSFTFVADTTENKGHLPFISCSSCTFDSLPLQTPVKTFRVEYFNAKDAARAYQILSGQSVFGMTLSVYGRVSYPSNSWTPPQSASEDESASRELKTEATTIYSSRNQRTNATSQFNSGNVAPAFVPQDLLPPPQPSSAPQWENEICTEHRVACANPDTNCLYCPSRTAVHQHFSFQLPPTPSPPVAVCSPVPAMQPHMLMSPPPPVSLQPIPMEFNYQPQMYGYQPWAFEKSVVANLGATPHPPAGPVPFAPQLIPFWHGEDVARMRGMGPPPPHALQPPFCVAPQATDCHYPTGMPMPTPPPFQMPPSPATSIEVAHTTLGISHSSASASSVAESFGRMSLQSAVPGYPGGNDVSTKNQLVVARIEDGLDTRTTVMIKNIPNKMSDKDLITYINKVCPRRIDFLYLRMDFQNGGSSPVHEFRRALKKSRLQRWLRFCQLH